VPYLKGGFRVVGLPEGITFKKPYNYGANQLKKIIEPAGNIQFIIDCHEHGKRDESSPPPLDEVKNLLAKIAGSDAAERVLFDSKANILEEEVVDLELSEEERVLLYSCLAKICSTPMRLKTYFCPYTQQLMRESGFFAQILGHCE
jgi:hypothetical protein